MDGIHTAALILGLLAGTEGDGFGISLAALDDLDGVGCDEMPSDLP